MDTKVIKRDGSTEDFDAEKIAKVTHAAGLSQEQAQSVAQKISDWVKKQTAQTISSLQIRDEVLAELKVVDSYAANLFDWYQQTKEEQ